MTKHTCPRCDRELKLTTASQLTDSMPYVWKCACGLYATEKNEGYQKRITPTNHESDTKHREKLYLTLSTKKYERKYTNILYLLLLFYRR